MLLLQLALKNEIDAISQKNAVRSNFMVSAKALQFIFFTVCQPRKKMVACVNLTPTWPTGPYIAHSFVNYYDYTYIYIITTLSNELESKMAKQWPSRIFLIEFTQIVVFHLSGCKF